MISPHRRVWPCKTRITTFMKPGVQDYKFTIWHHHLITNTLKVCRTVQAIDLTATNSCDHMSVSIDFRYGLSPPIGVKSHFCYRYCHRLVGVNNLTLILHNTASRWWILCQFTNNHFVIYRSPNARVATHVNFMQAWRCVKCHSREIFDYLDLVFLNQENFC